MNTLEEAWRWYQITRHQLKLMRRLGGRYWADLPWGGTLGRDDYFRVLQGETVANEADFSLAQLDDLAVVVLFSVFEYQVRQFVLADVKPEVEALKHPALQWAAAEATNQIAEGSFFRVLEPFKIDYASLVEEVNQVRRFRNWVAHGKGGEAPERMTPQVAYERLTRFLATFPGKPGVLGL
jgi:hypothetical protein